MILRNTLVSKPLAIDCEHSEVGNSAPMPQLPWHFQDNIDVLKTKYAALYPSDSHEVTSKMPLCHSFSLLADELFLLLTESESPKGPQKSLRQLSPFVEEENESQGP